MEEKEDQFHRKKEGSSPTGRIFLDIEEVPEKEGIDTFRPARGEYLGGDSVGPRSRMSPVGSKESKSNHQSPSCNLPEGDPCFPLGGRINI